MAQLRDARHERRVRLGFESQPTRGFRLNIGLSKQTFDGLVSAITDPDYAALDRVMPHPVYALQHWVSILNPTEATFDSIVKPLLDEAHGRVARSRHKLAVKK